MGYTSITMRQQPNDKNNQKTSRLTWGQYAVMNKIGEFISNNSKKHYKQVLDGTFLLLYIFSRLGNRKSYQYICWGNCQLILHKYLWSSLKSDKFSDWELYCRKNEVKSVQTKDRMVAISCWQYIASLTEGSGRIL